MNDLATQARSWNQRRRNIVDGAIAHVMRAGGLAVIGAIALIFLYLLWVVFPILEPATIKPLEVLPAAAPQAGRTMALGVNDSNDIGYRLTAQGQAVFFSTEDGTVLERRELKGIGKAGVRDILRVRADAHLYALWRPDDSIMLLELHFPVSFASGKRRQLVEIDYPFGEDPIEVGVRGGSPVADLAVYYEPTELTIAALTENEQLAITFFSEAERGYPPALPRNVQRDASNAHKVMLAGSQWLYLMLDDGRTQVWDVRYMDDPFPVATARVRDKGRSITDTSLLLGGTSLLVATDSGAIRQWFPVRAEDAETGYKLVSPRTFQGDSPAARIVTEQRRKGFLTLQRADDLALYHTTAHQQLVTHSLRSLSPVAIAISPRADLMLLEGSEGRLHKFDVNNEYPQISFGALWTRVWYEGYQSPEHVWQSSAASNQAEPKFGLMPLAFGTLKAALYAMLFATPLAIAGAIYTAYFMAPQMRGWVKPTIELMEALPTVILGFLAGLWLAPLVETYLSSVVSLLVLLPLGMMGFALLWHALPEWLTGWVPDGWHALILLPVIALLTIGAFELGPWLERVLLNGDARRWLRAGLGVDYDQRNALIVGIAMGLAVIPTIFSITEDAVFSVPRHLVNGSLALGATSWQTLVRVVLLTASPGIFSAVMIGFGRAVGETMIVLMATGNTAVMDWSPFSGMRTFSANIAVELPEAEVGSSHYRILFLTALVLFAVTFAFNTLAEVVRQRLRVRYGSL